MGRSTCRRPVLTAGPVAHDPGGPGPDGSNKAKTRSAMGHTGAPVPSKRFSHARGRVAEQPRLVRETGGARRPPLPSGAAKQRPTRTIPRKKLPKEHGPTPEPKFPRTKFFAKFFPEFFPKFCPTEFRPEFCPTKFCPGFCLDTKFFASPKLFSDTKRPRTKFSDPRTGVPRRPRHNPGRGFPRLRPRGPPDPTNKH